jgi:hypothetical protein
VNYEARVAAFLGAKMLMGAQTSVWSEISGADLVTITMQAPEEVDDIVVKLRGRAEERVFISAKHRGGTIALTGKSPAFAETVSAFVRQFLSLSSPERHKTRLLWVVPLSAGPRVVHELPLVLDEHRKSAGVRLSEFSRGRQTGKRQALESLLKVASSAWKTQTGHLPVEDELRELIRMMFVEVCDFAPGHRLEREIEGEIRSHIVSDPNDAPRAWKRLAHFSLEADCHGVPVNAVSLRQALTKDDIALRSPPDYAVDGDSLRTLTIQNLTRLEEHTRLCFGAQRDDIIHIPRTEEESALIGAVTQGHLLVTGEPGCGKSGLIHQLAEHLNRENFPVVLLLAEDNLPILAHKFDEIIANWPAGTHGFLITDALDAVRDVDRQEEVRRLLGSVQQGPSGWTVVASVREFDLKHSRKLREMFPGDGAEGYTCRDFAGVAHFHVPRLSESHLDELAARRPEIRPFIENARKSPKSESIHRSPFHLRLASELLRAGVTSARLADWLSPAVLLRKFWEVRIQEGSGASDRENVLKAVCGRMVNTRRMVASLKQLELSASEREQVDGLRGRGILQIPALQQGMQVGGDELKFAHHLLHDYAIARSLIPETPELLCDFAIQEPLLPIFYRQSFLFALEELWDAPDGHRGFWKAALQLEDMPKLHGIARILAPILAARRVESFANLKPLLTALNYATDPKAPAQKALQHFPHYDLHYLAENLRHLGSAGDGVVLRLFEAAFATEPEPGKWEQRGSAIMGMRFQTSGQWNSIHYELAGYYGARGGANAALMTEAACIVWNAVVRRRRGRRNREEQVLATINFRGIPCDLIEDHSHIWGSQLDYEESRILSHFEKLLQKWAVSEDGVLLNTALDRFAARSRNSLMWSALLECGARYPATLGVLLAGVLDESVFLTHPDCTYGSTALLGALHECGNFPQRENLEKLILYLPDHARLRKGETRTPVPLWLTHAQNRLLGVLKESNIVLKAIRDLRHQREAAEPLPLNPRPEAPRVTSHTLTAEELAERRGNDLKDPANLGMFRMKQALEPFSGDDKKRSSRQNSRSIGT